MTARGLDALRRTSGIQETIGQMTQPHKVAGGFSLGVSTRLTASRHGTNSTPMRRLMAARQPWPPTAWA
jgi:hypothetical protein